MPSAQTAPMRHASSSKVPDEDRPQDADSRSSRSHSPLDRRSRPECDVFLDGQHRSYRSPLPGMARLPRPPGNAPMLGLRILCANRKEAEYGGIQSDQPGATCRHGRFDARIHSPMNNRSDAWTGAKQKAYCRVGGTRDSARSEARATSGRSRAAQATRKSIRSNPSTRGGVVQYGSRELLAWMRPSRRAAGRIAAAPRSTIRSIFAGNVEESINYCYRWR